MTREFIFPFFLRKKKGERKRGERERALRSG